ncbi:MAG: alpha-hydroxy acid oxidase [Caldilineaceae bacterium]
MQLLNLLDYEKAAAAKMEPAHYTFFAGAAGDYITRDANRTAFDRLRLRPRVLRDVSRVSLATTINGAPTAAPILIGPASTHKLAHPDGEVAVARAAKALGLVQVLSTMSTTAVEEVAAVGHTLWFQLYIFRDRAWSKRIVRRAEAAGCQAMMVTVDTPVPGLREDIIRSGFVTPETLSYPNLVEPDDTQSVTNLMATVRANFDPALTWADIEWLRTITPLPIWVKGILRADDARRAVNAGVSGIVVSNHGGRQLDTAIASMDALPEIVDAVGDQVELILDGGVRRGTDVLKALALGAGAVTLGRPPLMGLAVNGEAGARHVLELLRDELANVMAQVGCATVADIFADLVVAG